MTKEDIQILTDDRVRQLINDHIDEDPIRFALTFQSNEIPISLVSTQLKYLQRAKDKLPTYYNYRALIPPLAYEQASSERAAQMKRFSGARCLDLTMGLGVDTLHFSHHFDHVTSLEIQPHLHQVGKHNFASMGISNVHMLHTSAEDFLHVYQDSPFDLIFVDPARRDAQGKRVYKLQDCAPNVIELWNNLRNIGKRIVVKVSPLYDIYAALREIPTLTGISVISIKNEVKEVWLEWEEGYEGSNLLKLRLFDGEKETEFRFDWEGAVPPLTLPDTHPPYWVEPDVAFYKARRLSTLAYNHQDTWARGLNDAMGFIAAEVAEWEDQIPGRIFEVKEVFPFKPKQLKKYFKAQDLTRLHVIQRAFPLTVAQIRQQLNLREGGKLYLLCTVWKGQKVAYLTERKK
ncbi:MAG: hypothetical protein AAF135_13665 [Bacteroidota bacterium]